MSNFNNQVNRKPPVVTTGVYGWIRKNLFSNWFNTIVTIIVAYSLYKLIPWFLDWSEGLMTLQR